jgi:hypothetical protein
MSWRNFEEECATYLNDNYGKKFQLRGNSDSTVSDIYFKNGKIEFYIEAKMPNAQCGQFVLFPDLINRQFVYSPKNRTQENEYSMMIIEFMNKNFDLFCDSGTAGIAINMPQIVFYNWIINYYNDKDARFFITKDYSKYIIFPIENFSKYFNVSAKYRKKKSGSSSLNNANKADFEIALKRSGIEYDLVGLEVYSSENLDGIKVSGDRFDYMFRENGDSYKVRRLSNTVNANVIFSIELKDYDIMQQKVDYLKFKRTINIYNRK